MSRFFAVCLGGALGSGARYLVSLWAQNRFGPDFPYGTVLVNLGGSFVMSLVLHASLVATSLSPTARLAITAGFLGGFTTYSSFNFETLRMLETGAWRAAMVNLFVTVLGCALAGWAGGALARRWLTG